MPKLSCRYWTQTVKVNCTLKMILHYCSRRCRRLRVRSSQGCQWKSRHSPAPSSGGWSSPSGGNRTGDNPPNTACTAEEGKIQKRPREESQESQQQRMWYAQQDNKYKNICDLMRGVRTISSQNSAFFNGLFFIFFKLDLKTLVVKPSPANCWAGIFFICWQ